MPLAGQSESRAPANRRGPIEILAAQGTTRIPELLPVRYARMKTDLFAFLCGAAGVMAGETRLGTDNRPAPAVVRQLSRDKFRRLHHSQGAADLRDQ